MAGEKNLNTLLASLSPRLVEGEFVFCTIPGARYGEFAGLFPLASFQEEQGLTIVVSKARADQAGLGYESVFRCITLSVHSSLEAVGLTAAVSGKLTEKGISANVIAGYFHDHIFVAADQADAALAALNEFSL